MAELGVQVESPGLVKACAYDAGTPNDDEVNEEPDDPEAAIPYVPATGIGAALFSRGKDTTPSSNWYGV
jgi:hypothetical protein